MDLSQIGRRSRSNFLHGQMFKSAEGYGENFLDLKYYIVNLAEGYGQIFFMKVLIISISLVCETPSLG